MAQAMNTKLVRTGQATLRITIALLALISWVLYLVHLPGQAALWWGYGLLFAGAAAGMALLGVSCLFAMPGRNVSLLAIAGLSLLVAVWLVTRIGGIPGLFTFAPLAIGVLDGFVVAFQIILIALLGGWLAVRSRPRRVRPWGFD